MINSLKAGLVSYWPLHEASGTRYDLVGTANNLTDNNTVARVSGIQVYAGGFTRASSQRLEISSNANLQTGDIDFTFACWVNLTSKPAGSQTLVSKYNVSAGNAEFFLYWDNVADRFNMAVYTATDSSKIAVANTFGAPSTAVWYFVVGWHDADANTVNVAVNASASDATATTGALQAAGTAPFSIGGNLAASNYMDGQIAEVGFWKRVLTTQERLWLYNKGRGRSYPFDGRFSPAMLGRHTYMVGPRRSRLVGIAA